MALPDYPISREEQYLSNIAGDETELPDYPVTRSEKYLAKIAGESVDLPDYPVTREEQYLAYIAEHGGGGGAPTMIDGTLMNPTILNFPGSSVYSNFVIALLGTTSTAAALSAAPTVTYVNLSQIGTAQMATGVTLVGANLQCVAYNTSNILVRSNDLISLNTSLVGSNAAFLSHQQIKYRGIFW